MAPASRRTGISVVGDVPWGTHVCHFYETKSDLLGTLVPYFEAGLDDGDFCVWVVSEPREEEEAWAAMRLAVPNMERYVADRSFQIFPAREWYLNGGKFDRQQVTAAWNAELERALGRGYVGMRVSGNAAWLDKKNRRDFIEYEERLNTSIVGRPMTVLCTYPLLTSRAAELLDVVRTHQFAIAKRQGQWQSVETRQPRQAKAEIETLSEQLERRVGVAERSGQLEIGREQLEMLKNELAADLVAMTRLHELGARFLVSEDLQRFLDEVLDAIIVLQNADFGTVQLYNRQTEALEIVAQRGFEQEFLDHFESGREGGAAWTRALTWQRRIHVEDVETDRDFAPHRHIAAAAGFRAVQSTPLFSRAGEPLGVISTHFRRPHRPSERDLRLTDLYARQAADMLERRWAEEALRRSEKRFRLLTEAIPHQVWGSLPDDTLNYCNQRWSDYSGLTRKAAAGERWAERLHPADVEYALNAWGQAAARHEPYEAEVRLRAADGSYRRFVSRAVPLFDGGGQLVQWLGTNTDVEERRQLRESLDKSLAEIAHVTRLTSLGELTVSLAHELSQPLAAVVTNGQACLHWLARGEPNLDEAMRGVRRMIRDANRVSEVIVHTRALVRKSQGEKLPLDVTAVVREILVFINSEVTRHRIDVRESIGEDIPQILGDRVQLQQVLLNLAMNAIHAMMEVHDGRELGIGVERAAIDGKPGVLVSVRDTGVGVAQENLGRLFEAFYTTRPDGLGMGLPISRSLIQAHEGRLWVIRNAGRGTTFQFLLPAWTGPGS